MDSKKIVERAQYTLTDVACYEYLCGKCGEREYLPQVIAKTFDKLAPEKWCCVVQDDLRSYYCPECALRIGIGC